MCGIAGKLSSTDAVPAELVSRMCDALRHRGPDAEGLHVKGPVGLGMRRLSIIDLQHGNQPFFSEDGAVAMVLNGEIYNHDSLREELQARGHRFRSRSDAEVVVHLWEEAGPDCVHRLRGMFAFAIWDERQGRLFLARDRVGKKPLYYAHRAGDFWFGSEPRAILQDPAVPRDVDLAAIDAYLGGGYVPHSLCAFAAMEKVPPGASLSWRPGEVPAVDRYWRPEFEPKHEISPAEAADRTRELLLEATRLRLMSDVPLGAFLSGGVDSSAVVAAMAMGSSQPVRTFSVAFADQEFDESRFARMVAERYGTIHEEIEVGPLDSSLLPRLAWHFGEPFADPAALPTFQLSELTRGHVTVALSGDGGDECFGGYDRYQKLAASRHADVLPPRLRSALFGSVGNRRRPTRDQHRFARIASRLAASPPVRYADSMGFFESADREALYGPELRSVAAERSARAHLEAAWVQTEGLDWSDRAVALDYTSYLPDDLLAKVDVTSMAHSLEVRAPLLDQEIVEFAARLPAKLKLERGQGKKVLREAVRPWLPAEVLDRPKQGFAVPLESWLRGELRPMAEDLLLDSRTHERGLFDRKAVERTLAEHAQGLDRTLVIWPMIQLELWYRTCVDAAPAAADEVVAAA